MKKDGSYFTHSSAGTWKLHVCNGSRLPPSVTAEGGTGGDNSEDSRRHRGSRHFLRTRMVREIADLKKRISSSQLHPSVTAHPEDIKKLLDDAYADIQKAAKTTDLYAQMADVLKEAGSDATPEDLVKRSRLMSAFLITGDT